MKINFTGLLLVVFYMGFAQQSEYNFIAYGIKEGISSSTINAILKDSYGYMWFATDDGLNRFDGTRFKVYRRQTTDSTTIGGTSILSLFEDKQGNLWIGTNQGLSLYNRKKDAFVNFGSLVNNLVRALCVDHLGNIWMGSYSGLYKFDPKTLLKRHYRVDITKTGQLLSNIVVSIFEDSKQRLWVGTNGGLHLYNKEKENFIVYQHSPGDTTTIADNGIHAIAEDEKGNIWLGHFGGLSKLLPGNKGFKNFKSAADNTNTLSNNHVYTIAPDKAGNLWVGTEEGLNLLDVSSQKVVRFLNDPRNKFSFSGKSLRSIFVDKNGIAWFGTSSKGVYKYDQNLAFFSLRESNPLDPHGLSSSVVTSFVEAPSGDLYIGTDGGGLNFYKRKTGKFELVNLSASGIKQPLAILALDKTNSEVWIGTYQQGLYVLNIVTGGVRHYTKGEDVDNISGNDVFAIKKDSKGFVWIGTNGEGIDRYDPKTKTFTHFNKDQQLPKNILPLNGYIRAIEEDHLGKVWIGSNGTGIAIYDPNISGFQVLTQGNSGLASNRVQTLYMDKRHSMWVGTAGGGLCKFDKNSGKFETYAEANGISNAFVYKILEDDANHLWLSTNNGLSSFDQDKKKFKNYTVHNGLQPGSFNLGSGLKTSTGDFFFGGVDGFNFFNPAALHTNQSVPAIVFTDLKLFHRSVSPADNEVIKEDISIAKEIRLDYKDNFSISFAALNFTSPQVDRYSYKLHGFDKDWNHIGNAYSAAYTNLEPGEYTFSVRATSDDGLWSTPEKSITIFVKPPFWKTPYAYGFYIFLLCFLIGLMRYLGIRRLKRRFALEQEKIREKQVIEKERWEAERQHEFDQLKIKFLTNLSHEFRTPISLIVGSVNTLLKKENSPESQDQLKLVKGNACRLLNLVNQLLDLRTIEEHELKLNLANGEFVSFVKEVADSFKDMSNEKQINFSFGSTIDELYTSFDKGKLERILFNLLSNAFKFTQREGAISLRIEKASGANVKLILSDTGIGLSSEIKEKIFERFFQGQTHGEVLNQGSGIGLSITSEFVKMHGGTITVDSKVGKGSTFTIEIPLIPVPKPQQDLITETGINEKDNVSAIPNTPLVHSAALPISDKPTILIVEDHDSFRSYMKENLQPYYKVVEACDGKDGWQKTLATHPSLIVSDVSMPVMDGFTLCRKLKADKRTCHIPIIILSALADNTNQFVGLETGVSDYLTKPFDFEILELKVKNLLTLGKTLKDTYTRQVKVGINEIIPPSEDEKLIMQIMNYIEANIDSPDLSVDDLSKHLFMSRKSLYTKILSLTGETPVEFIRSVKLDKAAALLANSKMRIGEIGYAVGFTSPNYFARAFKAKFDISPSECLRLKRGTEDSNANTPPTDTEM